MLLVVDPVGQIVSPNVDRRSNEARIAALRIPESQKTTITEHLGQRDQPAAFEYALERFEGCKLVLVGQEVLLICFTRERK